MHFNIIIYYIISHCNDTSVNANVAVSIAIQYIATVYILEWQYIYIYIYLSTLRQMQKHCALYVVHVWFIVSAGSAQV